jgi:hypothetical protein
MSRWPPEEDELRHGDITLEEDDGEDEAEEEDYYDIAPGDPDYDLSEAAGYADWEPPRRTLSIPQWLIVAVSLLLILVLLLPAILRFT